MAVLLIFFFLHFRKDRALWHGMIILEEEGKTGKKKLCARRQGQRPALLVSDEIFKNAEYPENLEHQHDQLQLQATVLDFLFPFR